MDRAGPGEMSRGGRGEDRGGFGGSSRLVLGGFGGGIRRGPGVPPGPLMVQMEGTRGGPGGPGMWINTSTVRNVETCPTRDTCKAALTTRLILNQKMF